jgi:hypothetical protein
VFGSFVLQDKVGMAIIGIVCSSLGILLINLEKREEDVPEDSLVTKVDEIFDADMLNVE